MDSLRTLLAKDGWTQPQTEPTPNSLVGQSIYVLGKGAGIVTGFSKARLGGTGKHAVHFADGPRDEKIDLRKKPGGGKLLNYMVMNVMSTSYRRKKKVIHRAPWSSDSEQLNLALTVLEAQHMWTSFDHQADLWTKIRMWESADSALVPNNKMTASDPGEDPSLVLRSSTAGTGRPNMGSVDLRKMQMQKPSSSAALDIVVEDASAVSMNEPAAALVAVSALHCCPVRRKDWNVAPVRHDLFSVLLGRITRTELV